MYAAAGHVTVDILPGGARRAGGTVLYGALAATLRGEAAHVLTAGADDLAALLPRVDGVTFERDEADATSTFRNRGTDRERVQELLGWGGMVAPRSTPVTTRVLHLGPVARELAPDWLDEAEQDVVVVLTPQGLVRGWPDAPTGTGPVHHEPIDPSWARALRRRVIVVVNAGELEWMRDLGDRAVAVGGALVVTDGPRDATVRTRAGTVSVPASPVELADDTGAGDVFATVIGLELAAGARLPAAVAAAHAAVGDLLGRIHELLPVDAPTP
ncbi:PfkB family carbohydrate kinase [Paraconexibacter algicola]|uniref:Carbohydrate kinase PfkB domain-containing protein n=1 Tax=Paraconexibacter algicola TaxID=2133960 RepID=A0A2T4UKU9_9ACTN|nr:PfkB family carbohydrate kinase [Paraconexibacter algicola]PTL59857.1 hypothetical protein C7Y72_09440 [Paraconexibacter algicola]